MQNQVSRSVIRHTGAMCFDDSLKHLADYLLHKLTVIHKVEYTYHHDVNSDSLKPNHF